MKKIIFLLFVFLIMSCSSDDNGNEQSNDAIIGTWTELGYGTVYTNGVDEFNEYTYFCVTLGRFIFNSDGTFHFKTYDGPDDDCFSTGILTGEWSKNGEQTYQFTIITDTSDEPQTGQEFEARIDFPENNKLRWIHTSSDSEIDYRYEIMVKVE